MIPVPGGLYLDGMVCRERASGFSCNNDLPLDYHSRLNLFLRPSPLIMKHLNLLSVFLSFSLLVGVMPVQAAEAVQSGDLPSFAQWEDYGQVRAKMIKAGWTPHVQADSDPCGATDLRCKGRPEMEACAGTGAANCKFSWKKKNKVIGICTVGEEARFSGFCN